MKQSKTHRHIIPQNAELGPRVNQHRVSCFGGQTLFFHTVNDDTVKTTTVLFIRNTVKRILMQTEIKQQI